MKVRTAKIFFFAFAAVLITLNGLTLASALPLTAGSQVYCDAHLGCLNVARDFSAYYEGGYHLLHDPSLVYQESKNVSGGMSPAFPSQQFRYAPFFLALFIVPLVVSFSYLKALYAFDVLQFLLLPIIAFLLFEIMIASPRSKSRGDPVDIRAFVGSSLTLSFALLQPLVPSAANLTFWSWSYFRLWLEGEARVLQLLLLVLTFYLIQRNSKFSGLSFVLSSFDPRISLASLPLVLLLCLKRRNLKRFGFGVAASFLAIYVPTLAYSNLGSQFFATMFIRDYTFYSYEWIPLLTVASLTASIMYFHLDGWARSIEPGWIHRKSPLFPRRPYGGLRVRPMATESTHLSRPGNELLRRYVI